MEFVETRAGAGWLRIASLGSSTCRYTLDVWRSETGKLVGRGTMTADTWSLIEGRTHGVVLVLSDDQPVRVDLTDVSGPRASFVTTGPLWLK